MNNLNIIVPMAGAGKRFQEMGYDKPKPFIDVGGEPMILRVLDNLPISKKLVLIIQGAHYPMLRETLEQVNIDDYTEKLSVVVLDELTDGAARTVLKAQDTVDDEAHLIIANSDQWIDWEPEHFYQHCCGMKLDGCIPIFMNEDTRWSYAQVDKNYQRVIEVKEKIVTPSHMATCGIYYFKTANLCFRAIESMIAAKKRVNGEFYLAPCYNEMIAWEKVVHVYPVPAMHGMGTHEDLVNTIDSGVFRK